MVDPTFTDPDLERARYDADRRADEDAAREAMHAWVWDHADEVRRQAAGETLTWLVSWAHDYVPEQVWTDPPRDVADLVDWQGLLETVLWRARQEERVTHERPAGGTRLAADERNERCPV